ncbi:MAG: cytochrome c [Nitrospinae bacterium]|nr:cytochrome c [Nitrospinota bacterium]
MKKSLLAVFLASTVSLVPLAYADAKRGEALFNDEKATKCIGCHRFGQAMVGPDLAGVSQRHTRSWIVRWLINAPATWNAKDPESEELRKRVKKKKVPVPAHAPPALTRQQVQDITDYLMTK